MLEIPPHIAALDEHQLRIYVTLLLKRIKEIVPRKERPKKRSLFIDGQKVPLGKVQIAIFAAFYNAKGKIVSNDNLFDEVLPWHLEGVTDDLIRTHIHQIRKKLKPTKFRIYNYSAQGYRMLRI